MGNLFLSGHGGWKPEYGYTKVPRGVSVCFYTHFAKKLMTGMEYKILDGSYTTTDRVIGEFSSCPNMRISGQDDEWTRRSESTLNKAHWGNDAGVLGIALGDSTMLGEFLDSMAGEMRQGDTLTIHWLACSTLQLNEVGGSSHGLNAEDFEHRAMPGRYRITNADGSERWI